MRQQYSSYNECIDFFKAAEKTHPDLFRIETIGTTWEERDIIAVTVSKGMENADSKPALFYTGTIHAREWIGIELSIAFAQYVLDHIQYDPHLNHLLERATLYMVPCANPDGFEYSRTHFSFWRKNRRQNADGSFGVDLNRNFSIGFAPNKNTSSNVYPGPSAFSEPETQALKAFAEDHPNITVALDYHSQGNVFFPAHNFIHEDVVGTTDLNVLAANMAEEIRRVSGREYGVHMGKPPTSLISGSGREFYYSLGALALVVEVGTRNISDYQEDMTEHIHEHISALGKALRETPNYAKKDGLPRVGSFIATDVSAKEATLSWEYPLTENIYFEIYRSDKANGFCRGSNRIGMTRSHGFTDRQIESNTNYYYFIRAVIKRGKRHVKSPYAPVVGIRTQPELSMFSKILYPRKEDVGYVGELTLKNKEHFGVNSLFVGISETKGICYGITSFPLETVPENAIITDARISFFPMNRVLVQVERYGEWRVGMIDERTVETLSSYDDVKQAKLLGYIDQPSGSHQLSQGIWHAYVFAEQERQLLQEALKRRKATFRMEGPKSLPMNRTSQLMQWDIGFGKYSSGLTYRPKLEISYTLPDARLELQSSSMITISRAGLDRSMLDVGYDAKGDRLYGCIAFDTIQMPDMENTVISEAYLVLHADSVSADDNIRFHVEMVKPLEDEKSYANVKNREVIERVGYEVSAETLKTHPQQHFVFDTFAINEMVRFSEAGEKLSFFLYATSEKTFCKSQKVQWLDETGQQLPSLVLNYIKKRKNGVDPVSNLRFVLERNMVKLLWENPDDAAFGGVIVVKNPFHVPCTPYDGQKLYGGKDNYTYDNFGDNNTAKYYAVFTYDDVPNFSSVAYLKYPAE